METRKIVRLLIFIFLFLSVFFGYLYVDEYTSKNVLSEDFVSSAIENLNGIGIEVDNGAIETFVPEKDIYVFGIASDEAYYKTISDTIIDTCLYDDVLKISFDVPDGASFGFYDAHESEKELGRIVFSSSDMAFSFYKNTINVSGGNEPEFSGDLTKVDKNMEKIVDKFASSISTGSRCSYRICGFSGDEELSVVSVTQTVDGYDITNAFINFVFLDNELVKVAGKWMVSEPKAKYHEVLCDGVNAIYNLKLDNVEKIHSQRIVYSMRKSDADKFFLVPGWEIVYTDKRGALIREFADAI